MPFRGLLARLGVLDTICRCLSSRTQESGLKSYRTDVPHQIKVRVRIFESYVLPSPLGTERYRIDSDDPLNAPTSVEFRDVAMGRTCRVID